MKVVLIDFLRTVAVGTATALWLILTVYVWIPRSAAVVSNERSEN
jgi:hypothetical protein